MSHAGTEDKLLAHLFPDANEDSRILDVGCGYGSTGLFVRNKVCLSKGWCELWGLDIFWPYVEMQRRMGIYDRVLFGSALEIDAPDRYFDYTIATHVIEHMVKEDGLKLLPELERVTRKRVIVSTPNGYTESGPLDDNEHNNHLSGWRPHEFKSRGYTTRVVAKNVNSKLLRAFASAVFRVRGKQWENEVIVAWKDMSRL